MAIALVAQTSKLGPSGGGAAPAINATGASLIVVTTSRYNVTAATPTDDQGRTYTALTNVENTSAFGVAGRIWYTENPTGSLASLVVTFAATNLYPAFGVSAWSGTATASVFDVQSTNNNGNAPSATSQPGSVTPGQNDSLVIAIAAYESTAACTIDGGFTELYDGPLVGGSYFGGMAAYLIQTTAAAANPTVTYGGSNANVTAIAAFKPSAAPASLQWLPSYAGARGTRRAVVVSGMTPRGSGT